MRALVFAAALLAACDGEESGDTVETGDADTDADSDADADSDSDADSDADVDASASFFVTSEGSDVAGGNFGGLEGGDVRCQNLAAGVGLGDKTWHAYLSSSLEDARDRIGAGPWYDVNGVMVAADVDSLHSNGIPSSSILDEHGAAIPREEHDIVTGSDDQGRVYSYNDSAFTCMDWRSSSGDYYTTVGHADWSSEENLYDNWNDSHETPCSQTGMQTTLCAGRVYCFAL